MPWVHGWVPWCMVGLLPPDAPVFDWSTPRDMAVVVEAVLMGAACDATGSVTGAAAGESAAATALPLASASATALASAAATALASFASWPRMSAQVWSRGKVGGCKGKMFRL